MSKTKTTEGLTHRLKSTLYRLLGTGSGVRSRGGRRLAPLQELEDRCLLSVTPIGAEFRVNTHTQGAQQTFPQTPQAVAINPTTGDYVVVWSSQGQNAGSGWDVYFQRYNAAGVAQGGETLVDTPVNGVNQQYASVTMNASGKFVVTWSSDQGGHWNVFAQRFNAGGVAQGSVISVDTPTNSDQEYSTVGIDSQGNFVITWSGHQSGNWQVYGNDFNQNGNSQGGPFQVSNGINDQMFSDVAMIGAGNSVITWSGHQSGNWDVYAQLYQFNFQPVGSIFRVNTATANDQEYSTAAMDASGNFTITWSGHQSGHWNIYAQSYLSNGASNGSEFQVNPATGQDQEYSSAAFAGNGNPIITWSSQNQDGSGWGVYAQQVTPTGTLVGSEVQVNTYTQNNQFYSSVAGAANGDVAIVWTSNNQDGSNFGVYSQRFTTGVSAAGINVTGSTFLVAEDNRVVRINASTGAVVATYLTGVLNDGSTFGPDGSLYVADYSINKILHYDATGTFLSSFGSGQLNSPQGLAFGPDGNLYVTNVNNTVQKYSPTGSFLGTFITAGSGGLSNAKAIVWGPDGNAYVSSYFNSEVIRYNGTTGAFMNVFATGSGGFEDLTFGPDNNLYVASYGDNTIYRYNGTDGASLGAFASGPQLVNPYGLRFDPAGNLDVTNRSAGTIQTFDGATGAFLGSLVTGLTSPAYLTSTTSLVTSETGSSASFTVALTSQPTATVTINLATSMPGQGSLSQSSLTFDASNWNTAQTVTVTGLDDHQVNGDQTYQVTGTAMSTDGVYNGMAMTPVTVTNKEADVAGFTVTPTSLQTSKAGASASFKVALTSQPVSPVTINLTSTNPAEGSLSSSSLTFNAANWNVAQTVTVTGLNDGMANGNPTYQINGAASSSDGNYNGLAMTPVTVTNFDASVGPVLTTSESGTSASFSIFLSGLPLFPVTVNLTNGNPAQGSLSQSSLTFNLLNWNVPQSVTVTGLDDHLVNGDQIYQITGVASSLDPSYNGSTMNPVTVTNTEADVAGINVVPTALTTSETGTAASFNVALTSQPIAPVTINLGMSVAGQGTLSQSSLTFDSSNWNVTQTVTVTGLDDHIVNGNQTYQITGTATSTDADYNNLAMTPVTITNTEADVAGITVAPTALTTSETGTAASFNVALTSQPIAPVTINLGMSVAGQGALSQASLTFDSSNWNVTQTVTLTGLDDHIVNGNQTYQITGTATSTDANYNNLAMTPVTVTNTEADVAGITVTPTSGLVTTPGGSANFSVVLTSQPTNPVIVPLTSSNPLAGAVSQPSVTFTAADWNLPKTVTVTSPTNPGFVGDVAFTIHVGPAVSADLVYDGRSASDVAMTLHVAPAALPIAPAPLPAPPTPIAAVVLLLVPPVVPTPTGIVSAGSGPHSAPTLSSAAIAVSPLGASTPSARGANEPLENGLPTLMAQAEIVANRTIHVFAPIPRSIWQTVQEVGATTLPEESPIHSLVSRILLLPTTPAQAQTAQSDDLLDVLSDDGERIPWTEPAVETTILVGTGILAGSGYVLLNSRLGLWLLGLVTARPLWKQFDPLEVLYAWDDDGRNRAVDGEDEETLMSLVD